MTLFYQHCSLNTITRPAAVTVTRYKLGDRVRIDLPDETYPDFRYHGEHGIVIGVDVDAAGPIYTVGLEDHYVTLDARYQDIRPPVTRNAYFQETE